MEKKEEGLSYNYRKIIKSSPTVKSYLYFNTKGKFVISISLNLVDIKDVENLEGIYIAKIFKDKALIESKSVFTLHFLEEAYYGLLDGE